MPAWSSACSTTAVSPRSRGTPATRSRGASTRSMPRSASAGCARTLPPPRQATLEGAMSAVQTRNRLESWVSFLRAHAAITRQLNADLLNDHGLTLSDYEVLLRLSNAEGRMMRRVDLAESVLLTASGITRLL